MGMFAWVACYGGWPGWGACVDGMLVWLACLCGWRASVGNVDGVPS